ncbi:MAG: DUF5686 family protein [Calditrichia bacterium]
MKKLIITFFTTVLLSATPGITTAQSLIKGEIRDAETGVSLPAANIQVAGTYKGTISNEQGRFILKPDSLPAILVVSYIGYETAQVPVALPFPENLKIELTPLAYELEPVIVTGEDPAVRIMRKVIENKQQWRSRLNTYRAQAYTRLVLENDTSITSIMESISTVYWDRKKGVREVIHSKRQTSNMTSSQNFASVALVRNLYDDNVEIAGHRLIGVTHPEALRHYRFRLTGQRMRDDLTVYDIAMEPKGKLQPAFRGTIAVLDSFFVLLEADLQPGEAVLFPPPVQNFRLRYRQQFSNFGGDFWLPVDVRVSGEIKIGMMLLEFPTIFYHRISRLSDYRINAAIPDSIFKSEELWTTDSTVAGQSPDSVFAENPEVVPFSNQEKNAYEKLDSTRTLEKAYRPSGPLARFVNLETDSGRDENRRHDSGNGSGLSDLTPLLFYNRVEEVAIGIKNRLDITRRFALQFSGGYEMGLRRGFFSGGFMWNHIGGSKFGISAEYRQQVSQRFYSASYNRFLNSFPALFGYRDYFDYFWLKGAKATLRFPLPLLNSSPLLTLRMEEHYSLNTQTNSSLIGRRPFGRPNPEVAELRLNSLEVRWRSSAEFVPLGLVGQNWVEFFVEKSSPELLQSEVDFTRGGLLAEFSLTTFLKRRLMPNQLHLRLSAGFTNGDLIPQRTGTLDGSLHGFAPFGVFRTLPSRVYEGDRYLGIFWEHNFRTVPFELLGLDRLVKKNISLILQGASGRSWISQEHLQQLNYLPGTPDQFHHEIGIGINGLFNLFRIDVTRRLDEPGLYMGIGLARLF